MDERKSFPSPFLRWAGGKRRLAETIVNMFPGDFKPLVNRFHEPFLGGGAVTFFLGNPENRFLVPGKQLFLNDLNEDLTITYTAIRDDVERLIRELEVLSRDTTKKKFEEIRSVVPRNEIKRAARFIYLNKTCFNGLWRVNSKGEFNVPWGKLKNPLIYSEDNLKAANERLRNSKITNVSFSTALEQAVKGDVVYLDPPYVPLNSTSNFSKYAKEDFGILDQYALAGVINGLTDKGVRVILSNSDTPLTRKIFGDFLYLHKITAGRSISAKASSRGDVTEIVGVNYKIQGLSDLAKSKLVG